jgi:DNA polymerase zeta
MTGRVIINLWRIMKNEINLTNYDLENVCFNILKRREPKFSYDTLTTWWVKGLHYNVSNYLLRRLHNMF